MDYRLFNQCPFWDWDCNVFLPEEMVLGLKLSDKISLDCEGAQLLLFIIFNVEIRFCCGFLDYYI